MLPLLLVLMMMLNGHGSSRSGVTTLLVLDVRTPPRLPIQSSQVGPKVSNSECSAKEIALVSTYFLSQKVIHNIQDALSEIESGVEIKLFIPSNVSLSLSFPIVSVVL